MSSTDCNACKSTVGQGNLKKRLVVCCDGTYSGVDKGTQDYASNVARLARVVSRAGFTKEGEKIPQIVYYQSGVGTGSLTKIDKARQGAFGGSLAENVCEAYNFLANNWGPGDEIFIFGFSRVAYTARSLAGFICQIGLLTPLQMDYFYEVYEAYKSRGELSFAETKWANETLVPGELGTVPPMEGVLTPTMGTRINHLRSVAHLHVTIKVVGVWDTVGSLQVTNWFGQAGDDSYFHTTKLSPKIENAFHALAIDESRGNFPPTLWYLDSNCLEKDGVTPKVNLKQVWFPGYHSDVGGHSAANIDTNSVDEIAFSWMIDQLNGLLQISGTALQKYILFRIGAHNFDTKNKNIRDLSTTWSSVAWSDGVLEETNTWQWWVPSLLSTAGSSYKRKPGETIAYEKVNGKKVQIPAQNFHEEIHPSVFHRVGKVESNTKKAYMPAPFDKEWKYVKAANGERGSWVKTSNGKQVVALNEYLIPLNEELKSNYKKATGYDHWEGSLERTFAPKEVLQVHDTLTRP